MLLQDRERNKRLYILEIYSGIIKKSIFIQQICLIFFTTSQEKSSDYHFPSILVIWHERDSYSFETLNFHRYARDFLRWFPATAVLVS